MIDLQRLSREKQLIQLRMSVFLDIQRTLEHTLGISPDTLLTVDEILDELQSHFKSQRSEALRRCELLCCKQAAGEPFSGCYVRLKNLAEEIDLCSGDSVTYAESQLKMVLLMGVREEELVQRLISLDTEQVTRTWSPAAAHLKLFGTAIQSSPRQLCAVSVYKKGKRHAKATYPPQPLFSRPRGSPQLLMQPNPASVVPTAMEPNSTLPLKAPATTADVRSIGQVLPSALPGKSAVFSARRPDTTTNSAE